MPSMDCPISDDTTEGSSGGPVNHGRGLTALDGSLRPALINDRGAGQILRVEATLDRPMSRR